MMRFWRLGGFLVSLALLTAGANSQTFVLSDDMHAPPGYSIPSCDDVGCDRQVVHPRDAISAFGGGYGASSWVDRVEADQSYGRDGGADDGQTCSAAVNALFNFVCGSDTNCEIEDRYDSLCLDDHASDDTQRRCVEVVDSYKAECFGGGCSPQMYPHKVSIRAGYLKNDGEQPFCSAVAINGAEFGLDDHEVIISAVNDRQDHCVDDIVEGSTIFFGNGVPGKAGYSFDADGPYDSRAAFYHYTGPGLSNVFAAKPEEFAETVFQGFNRLFHSRNMVNGSQRYSDQRYSPLWCDSSPLCTIVSIDSNRLLHTCQSTKGGSGGALFQNGQVVGLNIGSRGTGLVTNNEAIPIRQ